MPNTAAIHRNDDRTDLDVRVDDENARVGDIFRRYPLSDPTKGPARRRATRTLLAELLERPGHR